MPVEAPEAPAGAAADVSSIAPNRAATARDARTPRERQTPQRSKAAQEARAKVDAIAKEMSAKKSLLGDNASMEEFSAPAEAAKAEAKKAASTETTAPKADVQKDKPAAEPTAEEKAATAEKAKKVMAAKRALILDGWEPEDIDALKEDKLLSIGEHRAKNQADVNRTYDQLRKAATSPTGARNEDGTFAKPGETKGADKAPPEKSPDPATKAETKSSLAVGDAEIDAMIEAEKEDIGERPTKLLKAITSTLLARVDQAMKQSSYAGAEMAREVMNVRILDRIHEQHPEAIAADPKRFDEVVETLKAYIGSGRFKQGELHKAIDSAIYTEFGPPDTVRKAQRDALARQDAADRGRIDAGRGDKGSAASSSEAPKSKKEQLNLAAAMFAKNTGANLDALHTELMGKLKGKGKAA